MGRPAGPTDGEVPRALTTPEEVDPVLDRADEANPPMVRWLGMPFKGVVSVILRGIPLDLNGTVGAGFFFILFWASVDFWSSSALSVADFGFLFNVKCLTGCDWNVYI